MKPGFIWHPILIGAFPILFLYSHNVEQTPFGEVPVPLAASLILTAALWGALSLLVRSGAAAALITSLFLILFHSYGRLFSLCSHLVIAHVFLGRNRYFAAAFVLLLALGTWFILKGRGKDRMRAWTRFADFFGMAMVVISLAQIAGFMLMQRHGTAVSAASPGQAPVLNMMPAAASPSGEAILPDIYYIIPDSYEADSSLKEFFRYDNSPFTDFLKGKGFFIASKSASNYGFTLPSLASSLNMEMLDSLQGKMGRRSTDKNPLSEMIAANKVMAFLKSRGYTIINGGSWWGPTFKNSSADINLQANHFDEFTIKILEGTPLHSYMEEITDNDLRAKTDYVLDNLARIPDIKGPTFTLAHIICPHPPYVFGPKGEKVSSFSRILAKKAPRKYYLDQVRYVNMRLQDAVGKILARSSVPPIIIIQGDHGAAYIQPGPIYVDAMPDRDFSKEQMRIFNAYYLPGPGKGAIPDTIAPVNTFRVIFNTYFGTDLPLLENRNYYSNRVLPYAFMDVTEQVKYPAR